MKLHSLPNGKNARHRKKRLGKGHGTGLGKTSGRGHKGSGARSGYSISPTFEGGQMPLARKLPKRGFNNYRFRTEFACVNLSALNKLEATDVDRQVLVEAGLVRSSSKLVKILGNGEITKALKVSANAFSKSAKEKISAAGGEAITL